MKLIACGVIGLIIVAGAGGTVQRSAAADADAGAKEFRAFLREFEEGTNRFINGDATLWNQHVSYADDATIMGGFGAYEVGGGAVRERYDWAVKRFRSSGGKMDYTYLATGVSGDLTYTVTIDRVAVHLVDQAAPLPWPFASKRSSARNPAPGSSFIVTKTRSSPRRRQPPSLRTAPTGSNPRRHLPDTLSSSIPR
jgi:hypothetical protein